MPLVPVLDLGKQWPFAGGETNADEESSHDLEDEKWSYDQENFGMQYDLHNIRGTYVLLVTEAWEIPTSLYDSCPITTDVFIPLLQVLSSQAS